MIFSKYTATSLILSNSFLIAKSFKSKPALCEEKPKTQAEKGAQDLDAIFASQEGGLPPDAEEIQEMIMRAQGKKIR